MPLTVPWKQKWWPQCADAITQPFKNIEELEHRLDEFSRHVSNRKLRLVGMNATFEECFKYHPESREVASKVLPFMQRAAMTIVQAMPKIPLLESDTDGKFEIERGVALCLLAHMVFCTFDYVPRGETYANFSMRAAYHGNNWKLLRFVLEYFDAVMTSPHLLDGRFTIRRHSLRHIPDWESSRKIVPDVHITDKYIEHAGTNYVVDFANKYIGGGVLRHGCVQEEIMFMTAPECLVALLVCEVMSDADAITIENVRRYSNYRGYASKMEFAGRDDTHPVMNIVAVDAKPLRDGYSQKLQYTKLFDRDLNKALSGFSALPTPLYIPTVATGNWGCGAFGNDPESKLIQQVAAAGEAGILLTYCVVDDLPFMAKAQKFLSAIKNIEVGRLLRAYKAIPKHDNIFEDTLAMIERQRAL